MLSTTKHLKLFAIQCGLVLLATLWIGELVAQNPRFAHVTTKQGLSMNTVQCIVQDQDGFMWIGTDDGLNRYDGLTVRTFKNIPDDSTSISSNSIRALLVDPAGRLWIGTDDGGLNYYDANHETFKVIEADSLNGLSSAQVSSLLLRDDQSMWVGTSDGLNLLDLESLAVTRLTDETDDLPFDDVYCLYNTVDGQLWMGTYHGLVEMDPTSFEAKARPFVFPEGEDIPRNIKQIRVIFEDSRGNFWVGHDGAHLSLFYRQTGEIEHYVGYREDPNTLQGNRVTSLWEDVDGVLWIATNKGLHIFDYEEETFKSFNTNDSDPFSLNSSYVNCIYEDEAGSLWFGTQTGGANVFHSITNNFNHVQRDPQALFPMASNLIMCFAEDREGYLWIGSYDEGLMRYDRDSKRIDHYPKVLNGTHQSVLTMLPGPNGKLWFGTWGGGMNYYNTATGQFGMRLVKATSDLADNDVIVMVNAPDGKMWIGTYGGGLQLFDPATSTFELTIGTEDGLPGNRIFDLFTADDGTLWIATTKGWAAMRPGDHEIQVYDPAQGALSHPTINTIHVSRSGHVWMGTKQGLNRMDPTTGEVLHIHERDGLSGEIVYGLIEDRDGLLWVTTTGGVSRLYPDSIRADGIPFMKNYTVADGLQDNEFNQNSYFQSSSGRIYLGGINGYNDFRPDDIIDNPHVPPVVLTSFKIYGKTAVLDSVITQKTSLNLSYRDNFFSFEFAGLDYVAPNLNQYRYRMIGLSDEWSEPSNRTFASYTNLGGGDYVFEVQAANNDGVWNDETLTLDIHIDPPFWQTGLFYSLCIILGTFIVWLVMRLRTAKLKRDKAVLEAKVEERTNELAEKNREIEQKNKDITDSIVYAKRIQEAILPRRNVIFEELQDAFIFYRPKDIVSGDFYWYGSKNGKQIIAAVDCTGHGVPGAFMSMIGNNLLNQIVMEKGITEPGAILEDLNLGVQNALQQEAGADGANDGMDMAICTMDTNTGALSYAGAYRPLYIVSEGALAKTDGDKYPIGGAHMARERSYATHHYQLKKGDSFYIFSDGYPDQFGGPKGKKFMAKRFQRMILELQSLDMQAQKERFQGTLEEWMQDFEQIDDILVIGVRYS